MVPRYWLTLTRYLMRLDELVWELMLKGVPRREAEAVYGCAPIADVRPLAASVPVHL